MYALDNTIKLTTHTKQILCSSLWVVEAGMESSDNLLPLKSHTHQVSNSNIICFTSNCDRGKGERRGEERRERERERERERAQERAYITL